MTGICLCRAYTHVHVKWPVLPCGLVSLAAIESPDEIHTDWTGHPTRDCVWMCVWLPCPLWQDQWITVPGFWTNTTTSVHTIVIPSYLECAHYSTVLRWPTGLVRPFTAQREPCKAFVLEWKAIIERCKSIVYKTH